MFLRAFTGHLLQFVLCVNLQITVHLSRLRTAPKHHEIQPAMLRFVARLIQLLMLAVRVAPMLLLALASFSRALPASRRAGGTLLLALRIAQVEVQALID
jgi:hypothetical protein